jgi:hypothetical protein
MPLRIDDYSFGKIWVDARPYAADLILYPDRVEENWWRKQGHYLQVDDLSGLAGIPCDALVIGTGAHGAMKVAKEVEKWLKGKGIRWEAHPTGKACERYNALVGEGKRVVAALHLTC